MDGEQPYFGGLLNHGSYEPLANWDDPSSGSFLKPWIPTLPKTNIATQNRFFQKERIVFQPSIFWGELLVSGRVTSALTILTPPIETPDPPNDTPGASKQVVLTPHDTPRILRVEKKVLT